MNLTQHFTLEEFTMTQHRGIVNNLPSFLVPNAIQTCEMLERIRTYLSQLAGRDVPIFISSGYRCKALNDAVGSKDTSDHLRGWAADWTASSFGTPFDVCMALAPKVDDLGIGQLIHEFGTWTHTGVSKPMKAVNRIITISRAGTAVGVNKV
jgi:hypothetical protein